MAPREGIEAHTSLCPARDGDPDGMSAHQPGEPPSHRSKVGLGHGGIAILLHPTPQWRGDSAITGTLLKILVGLGGNAMFKSATLEEAMLQAPAPCWKLPWKNNTDNDNHAIPCCQRAAVNQGGGARGSAHLDILTQPRGFWNQEG